MTKRVACYAGFACFLLTSYFVLHGRTAAEQKKSGRSVLEQLLARGVDPRVSKIIPETLVVAPQPALIRREIPVPTEPRTVRLRGQTATVYPNIQMHPSTTTTQSEMSIATDPVNPNVVLAGSNAVSVFVDFGSQGWYHTTDGGVNWKGGDTLPTHTNPSTFMSDPAVGIDLGANLFFSALLLGAQSSDVVIAKSTNGGAVWTQTFVPDPSNDQDKDHFTVDVNPSSPHAGNLYAAYTDFEEVVPPIRFSRSIDGGATFSSPVSISNGVGKLFNQGVNMAVGPDGELYAVWTGYDFFPLQPGDSTRLGFNKSTDGGQTWQAAKTIRNVADIRGYLNKGGNIIRVASFPSMAVDRSAGPRRGWIYVVYAQIATTTLTADVFLIRSTDGGTTWNSPKKVSQENTATDQWFPATAVDPATGVLYVDYYDSRNFADDSAQVYVSISSDGGDTFQDVLVSDAPFLPASIPGLAGGYMGDYIGIAAVNGTVWPSWNDNRTGIHQAYTARMVTSTVSFPAKIRVSPDTLDFGARFIGFPETLAVLVRNLGTPDTLVVSGIGSDNPLFVPDADSFSLTGGAFRLVNVVFSPVAPGSFTGHLSISSSDSTQPLVTVALRGSAALPPQLAVLPDSLRVDLTTGESKAETLLISNPGGSDLSFQILKGAAGPALQANFNAAPSLPTASPLATGRPVTLSELKEMQAGIPETLQNFPDKLPDAIPGYNPTVPLEFSGAAAADSVEIFGGLQFPFTGGFRLRGNMFFCTDSANLTEHRFWLKTFGPTDLWFLVYEGTRPPLPQFFSAGRLISASYVKTSGAAEGWYSSGNVDVPLTPGHHYLIVTQFRQACTYYYQLCTSPCVSYPISTSFGRLEGPILLGNWNGGPIYAVPPETLQFVPWYALSLQGAYSAHQTLVTGPGTSWLAASADTGTVPPGGSRALPVVFDSKAFGSPSVGAGDYFANLIVSANFPATPAPAETVKVHLHLTAAPNLVFFGDSLDFGEAFVGFPDTLPFIVSNTGAETLRVSGITTSNPRFTLLNSPVFNLLPGQSRTLQVQFLPSGLGVETALLSISSNDPNEPVKNGFLKGAAVHPPVLSPAPDSFAVTLNQGKSLATTLSLHNTGLGTLSFSLHISPRPKVLLLSTDIDPFQIGDVQAKLLATGRFSVVDTIQLRFVDLPTMDQLRQYDAVLIWSGNLFMQPSAAAVGDLLADYVDMGGGVVTAFFAMDNDPRFPPGNMIEGRFNAENYWALQPGPPKRGRATLGTIHLPGHPTIQGVKLFDGGDFSDRLQGGTVALGGTLVASWSDGEPLVAFKGKKRVDLDFYPVSDSANCYQCNIGRWVSTTDGAILMADALEYVAGIAALAPNAGTAPPGGTANLSLSLAADVPRPGAYCADLIISSNDPTRRVDTIPVSLTVPAGPNLLPAKSSLDFGDAYVGFPDTLALRVYNNGSAPLSVSGINATNPRFSVLGSTAFSVLPGQFQDLKARFLPTSVGTDTGTLAIASNDAADPTVAVPLQGKGLLAPNISFSADSIFSTLLPGGKSALTLIIHNPGATDLKFSASISRTPPVEALLLRNGVASLVPTTEKVAAPGQVIRTILPDGNPRGLTFLRGHLWQIKAIYPGGGSGIGNDSIIELDPNTGQELSGFRLQEWDFYQGLTSDGTDLWVLRHPGFPTRADKYSPDGRFLASLPVPGSSTGGGAFGLAFDGVALRSIVGDDTSGLFFAHFTPSGTLLENIAIPFVPSSAFEQPNDMEWVAKHTGGHLWVGSGSRLFANQFDLSTNPAVLIQNFPFPTPFGTEYGNGITHDGENLFFAAGDLINPPVIYVADDGLDEFVSAQPESGLIPAGGSANLTVSFDASTLASGLKPGDYRTHLVFSSNDPSRPNVAVPVRLIVAQTCVTRGNVDGNSTIDIADIVALVQNVVFDTPLANPTAGDANCDGVVDLVDIVLLVQFVVFGTPQPCCL